MTRPVPAALEREDAVEVVAEIMKKLKQREKSAGNA
jgi:hypothetical protein